MVENAPYIYRFYADQWVDILRFFDQLHDTASDFRFTNVIKDPDVEEFIVYLGVNIPIDQIYLVLLEVKQNYPSCNIERITESIQYSDKIPVIISK